MIQIKPGITAICLLITTLLCGQFAVVNDKDGFINLRLDSKISSAVNDSLKNGYLIFVYENQNNWSYIDYQTGPQKIRSGFIYKDRYTVVTDFSKA